MNKTFELGMKVLLFNSRLKLFPGKLRSRWSGPYQVVQVFPYGAIELKHHSSDETFKVNDQRGKQYFGADAECTTVESFKDI